MEPIHLAVQTTVTVAKDIYLAATEEWPLPEDLPPPVLGVLKNFKAAYDEKNITGLRAVISKSYEGDLYDCEARQELLEFLEENLSSLPYGVKPRLEVRVFSVLVQSDECWRVLVDFKSSARLLRIPVASIDSGLVVCELRPVGRHSLLKIVSMTAYDPDDDEAGEEE